MLVALLVTIMTRMFGMHINMPTRAIFQCGGFIAASFATRVWQLHLSQGVPVGCGVGFLYIPNIAILSQWFSKKHSLVNGTSAAGSGIGGAIFSWASEAMI